jgi:hypothetical protein
MGRVQFSAAARTHDANVAAWTPSFQDSLYGGLASTTEVSICRSGMLQ